MEAVTDTALYARVRAACGDVHGLGHCLAHGEQHRWIPRDDPGELDAHAQNLVRVILDARANRAA